MAINPIPSEVESISHSGIEGPDSRAMEEFYEKVFGGARAEVCSRSYEGPRGGNPHPCGLVGDYLFVIFPIRDGTRLPSDDQLRGGTEGNPRHAFSLPRERFEQALEHLKRLKIPFEGPVTHPEAGPLGQSVYFKDVGGNFYEICWRRDLDVSYAPVPVSQG
jgi:hypothetical protein